MCGIGGWLPGSARKDELEAVGRRMAETITHRGPDARGVAFLPGAVGIFCHTRLKVIDLSDEAGQPFASADGRVLLTYNGEVYNFQELRAWLEKDGTRFRTSSDTEVIVQQYRRFGVDGLKALDGMFALGLWDAGQRRLILMRDRLGKKPLYWSKTKNGGLAFGSEIKVLGACPEVHLDLDSVRLPEFLMYGYVSTPRSLYRGVRKLAPGSLMVFEPGSSEPMVERYWSLPNVPSPLTTDIEEAKREVRRCLGESVGRRLVADVPLGVFLSGGIDSSIIVAEMARRADRVRTFAVGFDDDETYDETPFARDIAGRFGTEHTEIRVSASSDGLLEKLLEHHEEPYGDSSALAVYAVSKAAREHVTVVLTGDGGDELFAGYTRFRGGMVSSYLPTLVARGVRRILRRFPEPTGYKNSIALLGRLVEHCDRSPDEQMLAWNSFFSGPDLAALLRRDVLGEYDPWAPMTEQLDIVSVARANGSDRLDQILRHNLKTYLLDDLLVKTDRMTMAVSLEARSPFLDTALVELAFGLPSCLKLRRGQLKWILREAYRDELPRSVLDRQKHGFGVPVGAWWKGRLSSMVDDLLLGEGSDISSFLEPTAVRALIDEHRTGKRDHGQRIFLLIQLALWLRKLRQSVQRELRSVSNLR